jgi:hypothetical protein
MAPVIVAQDEVDLAIPYLRTALADDSVTVAGRVPTPRPVRLVVLRRSGQTRALHGILIRPRIDAQVWAANEADAVILGNLVEAHLLAAPGLLDDITDATSFLGPTPIPDGNDDTPRVLLTVTWQVRGTQQ